MSDAGCFDQDETIKAGKSCCAEGTCQKIGRRAGGTVDVSTEGFGPRRAGIVPRISELRSQLADWAIGCRRGRCAEESDEASRDQ